MRRRFFTRCALGLAALLSGVPVSALTSALAFAGGSFQAVVAGSFSADTLAFAMSSADEAWAALLSAGVGSLAVMVGAGLASGMDAVVSAGVSVSVGVGAAASVVVST